MACRSLIAVVVAAGFASCAFPDYVVEQDTAAILARVCSDGLRSAAETDVDCGGGCPPCRQEQACKEPSDCLTLACPDGRCRAASCDDDVKNGSESDRDCGGQCERRCDVGDDCGAAADCASGVCTDGSCQLPACDDGTRNGDETSSDCGGSCPACGSGAVCETDADCVSARCAGLVCVEPQCTDGAMNGDETGSDCGGSECGACSAGAGCREPTDCTSLVCDEDSFCAEPRCDDQVRNGSETDVDCGGGCAGCGELEVCATASDCATNVCQSERCVPAAPTGGLLARDGWTGTASHTFADDSPSDVLDDDPNTIWSTGTPQQPGMFFELDLGALHAFYSVELLCSVSGDAPAGLDVYLWQSGERGAPARTGVVGFPRTVIEFAAPQVARYIRLELSDSKLAWWCIDELYVRK